MRVSIHQSQYLPWPPYFRIIANSDVFVLMDSVQYQKNGVQNRNKIRNQQGDFWLTIPVTGHLGDRIHEKKLADDKWRSKHWKSISTSYGAAPYWQSYRADLEEIYSQNFTTLGQVNDRLFEFFLRRLEIPTRILRMSELNAEGQKSELVLDLCKKAGAEVYLSGEGAKGYLDEESFRGAGIEIRYLASVAPEYSQFQGGAFIPALSMLDMLMNVSVADIKTYLAGTPT